MAEFSNALGMFAAQREDNQDWAELDGAHFYRTAAGALGVFDRFYFKLTGNQNAEPVREKALQLVKSITELPGGSGQSVSRQRKWDIHDMRGVVKV